MNKYLSLLLVSLLMVSCNGSKSNSTEFGEPEAHTPEIPTALEASIAQSTITSNGPIVANGVSAALVTITLKTEDLLPVPNVVPTFSATNSSSTNVYGICSSTNSVGVSTCTLKSTTPEIKTLRLQTPVAFDGGTVSFIHDNVDHINSFISGDDNIVANGISSSVIRIKLKDLVGNSYTGTPTFRATNTNTTNIYGICSALDSNGEATCSLKTTKAEIKRLEILTPAYVSGDLIKFIAGAVDSSTSTISSTSTPVSDGVSLATAQVILKDVYGNPVADETPTMSATDTGGTNIYTMCTPGNSAGLSLCRFSSKKAETKTLTLLSPVSVTGGTVVFTPGAASGTYSDISGTTNVVANGVATSTVSITLKDAGQNSIPGVTPTFTATDSGSDNVYGACSVSDASGNSSCTMSSQSPELKTLRLTSPVFDDGGNVAFLSPGMNIMVPIDLIDRGLASNTTATIFDRSLYPLTTTDYVATTNNYYFEIIATNTNAGADYTVDLLGNSNAVLSTITVLRSTASPVRLRSTAITMPAGTNNLKIRVNATALASQLTVQMAKLLIKQTGATETKLWIPLTHYDQSGFANTTLLPIQQTSAVALTAYPTYITRWTRKDSLYTDLAANAYRFEALMTTNNAAAIATMAVHNVTDNLAVPASTINVIGTAYQWASTVLTDSASFANNKEYELRFRTDLATRIAYVFKAGISVKLTNLSKAEILNRIYLRRSATTSVLLNGGRLLWEASDYSHPRTYVETNGSVSAGGSASRELDDMATSDSATATPLVVDDSTLSISSTLGNFRTPELFLTDGNRFLIYDRVNSGTLTANTSFLAVKTTLR